MANYTGTGVTNAFAVKDVDAFRAALEHVDVEVVEQDGLVRVIDAHGDGGGWPTCYVDSEDEWQDFHLADVIAAHLADGHVAIVCEAGNEKHRYVVGWAVAINGAGERCQVSIDDIVAQARTLGQHVTAP